MEKYSVLARLSLLALIVRGLLGIGAIHGAIENEFIQRLFEDELTQKSWRILRKHVFANVESPKHAQHSEGRIASLSGNHPIFQFLPCCEEVAVSVPLATRTGFLSGSLR